MGREPVSIMGQSAALNCTADILQFRRMHGHAQLQLLLGSALRVRDWP